MNIIIVKKSSGQSINLNLSKIFVGIIGLFVLTSPFFFYCVGTLALDPVDPMAEFRNNPDLLKPVQDKLDRTVTTVYQQELVEQKKEIERLRAVSDESLMALTQKLGQLQARLMRLDALGKRLVDVAGLDKSEFDFDAEISIGGPAEDDVADAVKLEDYVAQLSRVANEIDEKTSQLAIIEQILFTEEFNKAVTPSGKPATSGYVSSNYGNRKDPFTGKKTLHKGVDIAGKRGSEIVSTADGIVIWSGNRNGYGYLVEIDHGHGITTRYGHNKEVIVKVGDKVKQGQIIAKMGSSGRSTGPHVHYEVLRNGVQINPSKYLLTAENN